MGKDLLPCIILRVAYLMPGDSRLYEVQTTLPQKELFTYQSASSCIILSDKTARLLVINLRFKTWVTGHQLHTDQNLNKRATNVTVTDDFSRSQLLLIGVSPSLMFSIQKA